MKMTYDPTAAMKQWPTQGPRESQAPSVEQTPEKREMQVVAPVATGSVAVCWTDAELAGFAVTKCEDIFEQMTEADAMDAPWWIRQAWNVGKAIRLKRQNKADIQSGPKAE